MSYELNFSNSVSLGTETVFSNTLITPNSLLGAEFEFDDNSDQTHTKLMDFTFAAINNTVGSEAGVQCIVIKSDVDGNVKFLDSGGSTLVGPLTVEPGETLIAARANGNGSTGGGSIPFNFTIPTSGTVAKVEANKVDNHGLSNVAITGFITVWVYYNRTSTETDN